MIYLPGILAFILLFMGIPVGISLLVSALLYFGFMTDTLTLVSVVQRMISLSMSTSFLTIPCFLMVGIVMNKCGISSRLLRWCNALVGHHEGGLAQVNVLLSTVNGGMCGSSGADAAMQCKMLVPTMVKEGYPIAFAAAVTAASGLIAPMIPPGNLLILYSSMTDVSVVRMFMAGYLPGILMCVSLMVVVGIVCHKNHYQSRSIRASFKEILVSTIDASWSILIMLVLIVGIRMGFFNVNEGAIVIIILCFVIGLFVYKSIKVKEIPELFIETFHLTGNIMIMLMGSLLFGFYLTWARIPQDITATLMTISTSKYGFMAIAMIIMLIMGMLMDGTAMVMIVTPIFYPIAVVYGVDLIQFGILIIMNAYIGSLTPPVGGVMYTVCNITKVSIPDFFKQVKPFIAVLLLLMILTAVIPEISTFIPNAVYGK